MESDTINLVPEVQAPPYSVTQYSAASTAEENLPLYTETHEPTVALTFAELSEALSDPKRDLEKDERLWQRFFDGYNPQPLGYESDYEQNQTKEDKFLTLLLSAISRGDGDIVALVLDHQLCTANSKVDDITPLVRAVSEKNVPITRQLLEHGADPNQYGYSVSSFTVFRTELTYVSCEDGAATGLLSELLCK